MHLTVLGCGPAEPQPDTAGSGLLLQAGGDALLLDCGPGVIGRLRQALEPRSLAGVVVSHLHADHYIDLIALRYLFDWTGSDRRMPIFLPPGGIEKLRSLTAAISERPTFFDDALDIREFEPQATLPIGPFTVSFTPGQHYVPAWALRVAGPEGAIVAYTGDSGPTRELGSAARSADVLVSEATLRSPAEDDRIRGHLTAGEAIELAATSHARQLLVTHFKSARRASLTARAARAPLPAIVAHPGLTLEVERGRVNLLADTFGNRRPGEPNGLQGVPRAAAVG